MPTHYNERSWAIDVISCINQIAAETHRPIRRAGGESTIRAHGSSLFPDVLLYRDSAASAILQGWELKMPDTGIDDPKFVENAQEKARALGLDSFLLWNVRVARLYMRNNLDVHEPVKTWDDLAFITDRDDVQRNESSWRALLRRIVSHLNDAFEQGAVPGRQLIEMYASGGITELLLHNEGGVADALQCAARRDGEINDRIELWWSDVEGEYAVENRFAALARANLMNWAGKFLFAHILREQDSRAAEVAKVTEDTSPSEALECFVRLSSNCDFWTIFQPNVGQHILSDTAWCHLLQLNALLSDIRIAEIDQNQLAAILETLASASSRKLRGQYATPPELARLVASLTLRDATGRFFDGCCGSGAIPRAALELKMERGVPQSHAVAQVWASDIDPQVLQLATFALAKPGFMGSVLHVFSHDAFTLDPTNAIPFRDPTTGVEMIKPLGRFQAIASNLPFVAQSGRPRYREALARSNRRLVEDGGETISGRADVAAFLPFELLRLLEPGGRLGIIITNAWLGTAWGSQFRRNLRRFFKFRALVTSGAGRWFRKSDVVANVLVLEKRSAPIEPDECSDEETRFVILKRRLEECADADAIRLCAAQIEQGQSHEDSISVRSLRYVDQQHFAEWGLAGHAQFVDCAWVRDLPLISLRSLFVVRRGERRGWDKLFYPKSEHGIEPEYIRPVLKSPTEIDSYVASPRRDGFFCSHTIQELHQRKRSGALAWIRRFENGVNDQGRPLREALARSGREWYEMRHENLAELAIPLNFGNRVFVVRLNTPAFVDQRFMSIFRLNPQIDLALTHALLNSATTLFMIEGMGFPRGLGALDLNKDHVEAHMHLLDPGILTVGQGNKILSAFAPLASRDIFDVADELDQPDRKAFDDCILDSFDIAVDRERIYDAIRALVSIRQAVQD